MVGGEVGGGTPLAALPSRLAPFRFHRVGAGARPVHLSRGAGNGWWSEASSDTWILRILWQTPQDDTAMRYYARFLERHGRTDEALSRQSRDAERNPANQEAWAPWSGTTQPWEGAPVG